MSLYAVAGAVKRAFLFAFVHNSSPLCLLTTMFLASEGGHILSGETHSFLYAELFALFQRLLCASGLQSPEPQSVLRIKS